MNILITKFPYSSLYGGGEHHTVSLVTELTKRDHKVFTVTSCGALRPPLKEHGHHVRRWWIGKDPVSKFSLATWPLRAPWAAASVWSMLLWYRFRHNTRAFYALSMQDKLLGTPLAKLLGMTVLWPEHSQFENWFRLNPLRFPYTFLSRFVTITVVANIMKEQAEGMGINPKNIKVIPAFAEASKYPPAPSDPERVKKLFRIGFVGRLAEEKGVEYLLNAVAKISDVVPCVVHIVGDGPKRGELEWLAEKLGIDRRVRFLGFQKNLAEHYAGMDVMVLPSTRLETFGIVLVEAMLSEKPVICSRVGGMPEVVGDYGVVVEPKNSQELADWLARTYHHYPEALSMAKGGRERAEQVFTLKRMADDYEELLTS